MTTSKSQGQGSDTERNASQGQLKTSQQAQSQGSVPQDPQQVHTQEQPLDTKPTLTQEKPPILVGRPVSKEVLEQRDQAISQATTAIEESAKQLIGITGALQTLYIAIFAFSDLRKQVQDLNLPFPVRLILLVLYFLPLMLWLASLYFATQIFIVRTVNKFFYNGTSMSHALEEVIERRRAMLVLFQRTLIGLILSSGMVLILLGAVVFLLSPTTSTPPPTQIIIVTPTPAVKATLTP